VPFGVHIHERPPVMTAVEREQWARESGSKGEDGEEYVGRIKRLVLERTAGAS
jgi:hypothetical protein